MAKSTFNNQKGVITLEMMIAMAIMVLVISSVVPIAFSNQTITTDALTNNEALFFAQQTIDALRTSATANFSSITTNSYGISSESITYNGRNTVVDISPCLKQVNTKLTWNIESRPQYSQLDTLLSSPSEAVAMGSDCILTPPPFNEWKSPTILSQPSGISGQATDLDVVNKVVFMSMIPSGNNKPNFFIVDTRNSVSNPNIYNLNTAGAGNQSSLNAVDVAHNASLNKDYAYVANAYFVKDANCNKDYSSQLQVIDVTDITAPILKASRTLSSIDGCGQFPAATSIYYYDNRVYVGTKFTAGSELTIFDVSNSNNPVELDNINVQRNVNAIVVSKGLAYLATGSGSHFNNPLLIYDVNPASPNYKKQVGSFLTHTVDGPSDIEGTSLYLLGSTLYLGRDKGIAAKGSKPEEPDFYILNVSDPANIQIIGSKLLGFNGTNTYISGIRVSSGLAFIGITDPNNPFEVWEVPGLVQHNIGAFNFSQGATGVDYENNTIYTSNTSSSPLTIIKSTP